MFRSTRAAGSSLALVLWVSVLILVLGLVLSSLATSHLQYSSRLESQMKAEAAAEAVIALGLERVQKTPEFGVEPEPEHSLDIQLEGARGRLSFHPGTCSTWEIPLSESNRFHVDSTVAQDGSLIPARSIRLIGVGEAGSARRTVEVILQIPEFPYAIASTGQVVSDGALVVGSVESLDELEDGVANDELGPGDMVSNHSITLSGDAFISGRVKSHGRISLSESVKISGQIDEFSDKVELVDLDVAGSRPDSSEPLIGSFTDVVVTDSRHYNGPSLLISNGLRLNQGVLYVNGDLHVSGGLSGEGALIVNGELTVDGGAAFAADDQIAILAAGDVRIAGEGQNSSIFQGLIYSGGDLYAENTTLLGVFVANGEGDRGQVHLKDVRVLHHAEYGEFKVDGLAFVVYYNSPDYTSDPSGEKTLLLISVDESDIGPIREAIGSYTPEREGNDQPASGQSEIIVPPPIENYLPMIRGRQATSVDGVLVSDWVELTDDQLLAALWGIQGEVWDRLAFTDYEADPTIPMAREIRTSFVFDLNQFLVPSSQSRLIHWDSY